MKSIYKSIKIISYYLSSQIMNNKINNNGTILKLIKIQQIYFNLNMMSHITT